ncbi:MAG: M28 family peptidase [Pirellulaceae bacterium]
MNRWAGLAMVALTIAAFATSIAGAQVPEGDVLVDDPALAAKLQSELLSDIRQLTFDGARAGEGYFSADGKQLVFQSEREPENPFFQIYLMDRENGDVHRISPGIGKTTCAWLHPDGQRILYASTQFDPEAEQKQRDELAFRASGEKRRYSWDYDPQYDLVVFNTMTGQTEQLTDQVGYDAEGSYSPDGKWICFASNRRAYSGELSEEEQKLFEVDPASAMDLYRMRSDGRDVQRLTTAIGYDGGPFFSPDGNQICFRRFSPDGVTAEIMLMNTDGSDQRAITQLKHMSWAPFFHPSGDYLIFATNLHGFGNFELYLVDAAGEHSPVRVTYRDGFDGLPVFTPDGNELVWTSRGSNSQSQLFEAHWNDASARRLLGLDAAARQSERSSESPLAASEDKNPIGVSEAVKSAKLTAPGFLAADIGRHIDYLCRPELGGRMTGTEGERNATAYVAAYLESIGLQPAGRDGTFFHEFEFVSSVKLGAGNSLKLVGQETKTTVPAGPDRADNSDNVPATTSAYQLDEDWRPVFFSQEGRIDPTAVVFAGYGIVAPSDTEMTSEVGSPEDRAEYDSYVHLDVTDKWVLVFRQMPQDISPERRQHLARYSGARYKAMVARDRGARGLILVSGPTSPLRQRLIPLEMDGTLGGSSLAVISVADEAAAEWMAAAGQNLRDIQTELDQGDLAMGFELPGIRLEANIDIEPVTSHGRNVLALLPGNGGGGQAAQSASRPAADRSENTGSPLPMIVLGAHIDHLGTGGSGGSLAKEDERGGVHRGADDNASGVAGMLEIAQYLAGEMQPASSALKRDILFAAWSGEELGLRGSQAFVEDFAELYPDRSQAFNGLQAASGNATQQQSTASSTLEENSSSEPPSTGLYPAISANINLDMIGRLRDNLVLQGIGSSPYWTGAIERRNAVVRLPLVLQNDCHLPTDASTFFMRGVPILSAFTGSHEEYHTPRDVPELINYEGAAQVARLLALIARDLLLADQPPEYQEQQAQPEMRANLTAYLGTIPDYSQSDLKGVKLAGVTKGAPSDLAGLQAGDIIVELAGRKIENIYDYTYAIEALKVGQETSVKIQRGAETLKLGVTPASRQ